jgi:hypothetical protein
MRDIPGYEGLYMITRDGRVWSYPREWICGSSWTKKSHNGMWLSSRSQLRYHLCNGKDQKILKVAALVAKTYLPEQKKGDKLSFKDGDKANCHINNLEWTKGSREQYRYHRKKISQYTKDGKYIKTFPSIITAAKILSLDDSSISNCLNGKHKTAGNFIWRYAD